MISDRELIRRRPARGFVGAGDIFLLDRVADELAERLCRGADRFDLAL